MEKREKKEESYDSLEFVLILFCGVNSPLGRRALVHRSVLIPIKDRGSLRERKREGKRMLRERLMNSDDRFFLRSAVRSFVLTTVSSP